MEREIEEVEVTTPETGTGNRRTEDPVPPTTSAAEQHDSAPQASEFSHFQQLDPQGVFLWRLEGLMLSGTLSMGGIIGGILLWTQAGAPAWAIWIGWAFLAAFVALTTWWLPPHKYSGWSYRLDEQVMEFRFGVVWKTLVMIPVSRVQHIDIKRGPLERRYGLATLTIHTAGTKHAQHEIPHLESEVALRLRERLIEIAGLPLE